MNIHSDIEDAEYLAAIELRKRPVTPGAISGTDARAFCFARQFIVSSRINCER